MNNTQHDEPIEYLCPFCHDPDSPPDAKGTGKADLELSDEEHCGECDGTGVVRYDASYYGLKPLRSE